MPFEFQTVLIVYPWLIQDNQIFRYIKERFIRRMGLFYFFAYIEIIIHFFFVVPKIKGWSELI